jgi:hypothetical protein
MPSRHENNIPISMKRTIIQLYYYNNIFMEFSAPLFFFFYGPPRAHVLDERIGRTTGPCPSAPEFTGPNYVLICFVLRIDEPMEQFISTESSFFQFDGDQIFHLH